MSEKPNETNEKTEEIQPLNEEEIEKIKQLV